MGQVVLTGQGKNFCGGIDFSALHHILQLRNQDCPGRAREQLRRSIMQWQVSNSRHDGNICTSAAWEALYVPEAQFNSYAGFIDSF